MPQLPLSKVEVLYLLAQPRFFHACPSLPGCAVQAGGHKTSESSLALNSIEPGLHIALTIARSPRYLAFSMQERRYAHKENPRESGLQHSKRESIGDSLRLVALNYLIKPVATVPSSSRVCYFASANV